MTKSVLTILAIVASALSANAITISPITQTAFYAGEGSEVFAVRAKDFGNSGDGDIYLGKGNLGDSDNRVETNHNWLGALAVQGFDVNPFSLTYSAVTGIVKVVVGATTLEDVFEKGFSIDRFTVQLRNGEEQMLLALMNLNLNGVALGGFFPIPYGTNCVEVSDLPVGDFSLSGDLLIQSGYEAHGEHAKIELKAFGSKVNVPDSGATLALLGLALLGLAGVRKRFSK